MTTLAEKAAEQGVLICEVPIQYGPNAGESARGTLTGFQRHMNAGERAEDMDDECREFRNAFVRGWQASQKAKRENRVVHAVLGDGAEIVRYQSSKKWYLERKVSGGEMHRQKVQVSTAAGLIKNDPEVDYRKGLDGSAGLEKLLPQRLVA